MNPPYAICAAQPSSTPLTFLRSQLGVLVLQLLHRLLSVSGVRLQRRLRRHQLGQLLLRHLQLLFLLRLGLLAPRQSLLQLFQLGLRFRRRFFSPGVRRRERRLSLDAVDDGRFQRLEESGESPVDDEVLAVRILVVAAACCCVVLLVTAKVLVII